MKDIKLGRQVYKTSRGTTAIYEALYDEERCYAIVHMETRFTAIFDYRKQSLESMKRFMKERGYTLSYDKDPAGLPRFRFMHGDSNRDRVDLRQFLFARYNKRRLSSLSGPVILRHDDRADNFCDLRRYNLYMPGESIENREDINVRVISNPSKENENWIEVTFNSEEPFTEYVPYTPALWEMLNTPRYVRIDNMGGNRGAVEVDGYSIPNQLARFICIYKKYFPALYQGRRNAVKKFITDYDKLLEMEKGNDAAHVNSYTSDNSFENLMFMDSSTNKAMSDYIKWLDDGYDAYTAVNNRDEILLEFITPLRESPLYIKFETPEDYADFQRVYIFGTKLSKKMQRVIYPTPEGPAYQLTPIGMKKAGIVNRDSVNAKELDFWTDREHKDTLLSLPDEAFTVYHKEKLERVRVIHGLPEGMKKGDKAFIPVNGGGIAMVELVKVGHKKTGAENVTPEANEG